MTVEQNILCGLKAERDKAARKARCAGMLRALRLEELASRRPAELSGGQQQRTALARILVGKPRILMLDEPFSALDSYLREEVEGEVGSLLAGFDGTALLVTHNRDEAYRLCREMIVMDGGQVLRTGTTKEVFADPGSTAAARLTGCKNILPCTRVDAHSVRLAGSENLLHLAAEVPEAAPPWASAPTTLPPAPRRRERPAGGAALGQREPLRLEPHLPAAGRHHPSVVEGEQDDPLRGRTRCPGLPLRPAGAHHGAGGA